MPKFNWDIFDNFQTLCTVINNTTEKLHLRIYFLYDLFIEWKAG